MTIEKETDVSDPIEDENDDDLYDIQPPPGPTPREVRRRWVEEGNVEAFLDLLHTKHWGLFSIHEQLRNIQRACEVKAMRDPAAFSGDMFARMIAFNAFLVMRSQLFVAERVVGRGELTSTPTIAALSSDVAERLLPRLLELQKAMAEILAAQAQTARLWGLARAKEAQADGAAPANRKESRRPRSPGGKTGRTKSSAAATRVEGSRDDVLPIPARGPRRG